MDSPHYSISNTSRYFIVFVVTLAAFIEVLDSTIITVSLPKMMSSLGANPEQITWILTSYIAAAAVCMSITGFLTNRYGQKKLLLISIGGFFTASVLCGLAISLQEMVIFRILQGAFGASLVPLSDMILRRTFSLDEQGKAMAIWGLGIMVAPVIGPTIGGYITEIFNWRWVFYINVPICIFAFISTFLFIEESVKTEIKIDWLSFAFIGIGIVCFQIFIDCGNQNDWFQSQKIIQIFIWSVVGFTLFIWRAIKNKKSILNMQLFCDKNFTSATLLTTIYCIGLFGIVALEPMLIGNCMNFPTNTIGLIMMPRGIASAISMILGAQLMHRYDPRILIFSGILLSALGAWMLSRFALQTSISYMLWAGAVSGLGIGLFFVPISVLGFSNLTSQLAADASSIYSLSRNLGSSIGISVVSTILSHKSQVNWNHLCDHLQATNSGVQHWLSQQRLLSHHISLQVLAKQVSTQASILAFINIFWLISIMLLIVAPMAFLLKKPVYVTNVSGTFH